MAYAQEVSFLHPMAQISSPVNIINNLVCNHNYVPWGEVNYLAGESVS